MQQGNDYMLRTMRNDLRKMEVAGVFACNPRTIRRYDDGLYRALVWNFSRRRRWIDGNALHHRRRGNSGADPLSRDLRRVDSASSRLNACSGGADPLQGDDQLFTYGTEMAMATFALRDEF